MDAGPPYPAFGGVGGTASAERPSSDMNGYAVSNAQISPQSSHPAQGSYSVGIVPNANFNGQENSNIDSYRAPPAGTNYPPNANQQLPPWTGQPLTPTTNTMSGSGNVENMGGHPHHIEQPVNTTNQDQSSYSGFANRWQDYSQFEYQRRSIAISQAVPQVTPPSPFYVNGRPHQQVYAHPGPVLQHVGTQAVSQPAFQIVSQAQINVPVPAQAQHVSNVGAPPVYPPNIPRTNPYMHFPLSGVSSGGSQHRRNQRTQSLASGGGSTSGSNNPRFGASNSRRRSRPSDDAGFQPPRRGSTAQVPRTPSATIDSLTPLGDYYLPSLNAQQRAEIARRLQLGELLRNMHSDEARALQIYEESLLHSRRYHQEFDTYEGSPPPKSLDNQDDGRPEPKETEELTVNLECKICMSQLVDTVMLPCGHAILCRWCADQHMPSSRADRSRPKGHASCPMCRAPVKQKFRIYLS